MRFSPWGIRWEFWLPSALGLLAREAFKRALAELAPRPPCWPLVGRRQALQGPFAAWLGCGALVAGSGGHLVAGLAKVPPPLGVAYRRFGCGMPLAPPGRPWPSGPPQRAPGRSFWLACCPVRGPRMPLEAPALDQPGAGPPWCPWACWRGFLARPRGNGKQGCGSPCPRGGGSVLVGRGGPGGFGGGVQNQGGPPPAGEKVLGLAPPESRENAGVLEKSEGVRKFVVGNSMFTKHNGFHRSTNRRRERTR